MDTLTAMKVFCSVVENDSLAGASRTLNVSPSVVSKQLSGLEDRLGVRLLNRTTRRVSLTEVGSAYYERCKRILADVDEAEIAVSQAHSAPRGLLKVTAPTTFAHRHVAPHLPEFLDRYPEVEVQLLVNDRVVDLVDEGIDLAIRIAQLKDSSLIARKLAVNHRMIVASPDYVKKWGKPETPDQLSDHSLITYAPGNPINDWHFMVDNQQKILRARGTLAMNNGDSVLQTVLAGGGLAMLAAFMAGEHVKTGKLVTLLDEYVREDVPIYAVYPSGRHLSPKVRAFVDFLVELYGPSPYWL
ncbi:LysR family transcriptional regulator [Nisaea sediminum]|jgi:DNA-binding transcriptional LysR family regulator|uniref:LysR family transcriptional regulator n=2 Tax=Nisaea TaxID=390876 RepID=UPI0018693ADD|nr:LysR family transcriptional regulator [Nisaea sediminum]MBO6562765.1 LysR family transcriptional regulator [Nisaea sp.]